MQSPGIGPIEPLFADRPKAYRSVIINGLNKLVYYVAILLDFRWQDAIFCFEATSKVAGRVETTLHGDLGGIMAVAQQLHSLGQTVLADIFICGDASK